MAKPLPRPVKNPQAVERGESLYGYLARVGELNDFEHIGDIFNAAGVAPSRPRPTKFSDEELLRLSTLCGGSLLAVRNIAPRQDRIGRHVVHTLTPWNHRAFCPHCAREKHHQITWYVIGFDVCTFHGVKLIRECPFCDKAFTWAGARFDHCNRCRENLSKTSAEPVQQERYIAQEYLENVLLDREQDEPALLAGKTFLDVVECLFRLGLTKHVAWRNKRLHPRDAQYTDALNEGIRLSRLSEEDLVRELALELMRDGVLNVDLVEMLSEYRTQRCLDYFPEFSEVIDRLFASDPDVAPFAQKCLEKLDRSRMRRPRMKHQYKAGGGFA